MRSMRPLTFVVLAGLFVMPAAAQIYKSIDANGRTVFSDAPPAGGAARLDGVRAVPPPPAPAAAVDWAQKDRELRERMQLREVERLRDRRMAIKSPVDCMSARDAQKELNRIHGKHAYSRDSKGERVWLGDDEREKIQIKVKEAITKNCE